MASNKDRLYVAVYPSGLANDEEPRYNWGFIIGPKKEFQPEVPGVRLDVRNRPGVGWKCSEVKVPNVRNTDGLLARLVVAKVLDRQRLLEIVRTAPLAQDNPDWRCSAWVADVMDRIARDGTAVGTAQLNWPEVEKKAREYVDWKAARQRFTAGADVTNLKPTWDMLTGREHSP